MNLPYLPLYTGDWKKDPKLSLCSVATRGVWIDLLCSLHDGRIGQVTGTPEQIARLCRCNAAECHAALLELQTSGAANVSERDGMFTVVCRRMKKAMDISQLRAEAASKRISKPLAKPKQTHDIEIEDGSGSRKKRANSLAEVISFCREIGLPKQDAEWFWHKCEANGWQNGSKTIRDWRQTLLSWKAGNYVPSRKNGYGTPKPDKGPFVPGLSRDRPIREPSEEELEAQRNIIREAKGTLKL